MNDPTSVDHTNRRNSLLNKEFQTTTTNGKEHQTITNEEQVISHGNFRTIIDRLAHPQMCYVCESIILEFM